MDGWASGHLLVMDMRRIRHPNDPGLRRGRTRFLWLVGSVQVLSIVVGAIVGYQLGSGQRWITAGIGGLLGGLISELRAWLLLRFCLRCVRRASARLEGADRRPAEPAGEGTRSRRTAGGTAGED